ncbi:Metallo-dependent phosphatase-like protein, partial [Ochromonadaceae sp. CCMP2298]
VTVTFSSSAPSGSDWIGAYSPPGQDVTQTTPVKYGWCDETDSYTTQGAGVLTFNLTNLREDVEFIYFTNSTSHAVVVLVSEQRVSFKNPNQPLRPRVVATGDLDVLNLLWSSATSTAPTLKWGTTSGVYGTEVGAETSSIEQDEVCGAPASTYGWRNLGLIHTAPMAGMKALAGEKVYYVFGDEETQDYSGEFVLHVPPLPGSVVVEGGVRPTRAILYDDLGRGSSDSTFTWNEYGRPSMYTMQSVGALVDAGEVDVIYHGGDISYATGYIAVWDFFMDMISPVAAGVVYLSTVGNHESDWYDSASYFSNGDSGGECGVLTTKLLPMPAPATTNKPWWSYEVGMMHFVGMSTEHEYEVGSEQYKWLEADLASVDRDITPWIIFGGHRAMYLNSDYGGSEGSDISVMDRLILNIEPLLYKYRVNLGFYGHNHVVQRQSAVFKKEVVQASRVGLDDAGNTVHYQDDPQATVHMVVGTGGATFTKNALDPAPEWNEMVFYEYGYAKLTAFNATYLDWQWVQAETGEVLDRMVITQ